MSDGRGEGEKAELPLSRASGRMIGYSVKWLESEIFKRRPQSSVRDAPIGHRNCKSKLGQTTY